MTSSNYPKIRFIFKSPPLSIGANGQGEHLYKKGRLRQKILDMYKPKT